MVTIITGITGNVSIDDNGDRNADYSLLDMDPDTGEFEVTINNLMNIHDFWYDLVYLLAYLYGEFEVTINKFYNYSCLLDNFTYLPAYLPGKFEVTLYNFYEYSWLLK